MNDIIRTRILKATPIFHDIMESKTKQVFEYLPEQIDSFDDKYAWLSNMYPAPVEYEGMAFLSSEAAYQAAKTDNIEDRLVFQTMNGYQAKRAGRKLTLREDWMQIRDQVMMDILWDKFTRSEYLGVELLSTYPTPLIEGNPWGDQYWGVSRGSGKNKLGEILMSIREDLRRMVMDE